MTDIVERLRNTPILRSDVANGKLCREAADEIKRHCNDYSILKRDYDAMRTERDDWYMRALKAEHDNERLRAEHQRIVDHYDMRSELHTNDDDLAATLADIARLCPGAKAMTELDLAEFARWAIENGSWDGALGLDGGDIQEKAVACGILVETKYDPETHGSNDVDCEPGDNWYVYSSAFMATRRALEPKT